MKTALLISTLLLALTIPFSNNASLTAIEQKKYKQFLEGQGLYASTDDVDVLTVHNFQRDVIASPKAWLVEFYNSWCGFCQRFAPSWKALGSDIKPWGDLVRVAAFDCSDDDNAAICREYEIMSYPTVRYFHENYKAGPQKLGLTVTKGDDVESHRYNLIQVLITEQVENRGGIYPDLKIYSETNLTRFFEGAPGATYGFLVIEEPGGIRGPELALDLHRTPNVLIRHAYTDQTQLLTNLKITGTALIALDKTSTEILTTKITRKELREKVVAYLKSRNVEVTTSAPLNKEIYTGKWLEAPVPDMATLIQERARQALKERLKKMGDVVFQMDLETAVRYALKHEVAALKTLTGAKLQALQAFVEVLRKYFPFGPGGRLFLTELSITLGASESVDGVLVSNAINQAETGGTVFSSPPEWLACKGSSAAFRGYPCGLWKLFHYLTVNSAEQNVYDKKADPLEVLKAMHGYIKYFFGCADCSRHFQEMALKRDMVKVSSLDSSIVWLWMAHNEVNRRLAGDQTEDPEFPKYQFPSTDHCPLCRFPNKTWDLSQVGVYVKNMYSNINIRYLGSDTRILHVGLGRDVEASRSNATSGSSSIFSSLDSSMFFVLYVCSFLLLALLIRMFLKRGYRKKPYVHDLLGKV